MENKNTGFGKVGSILKSNAQNIIKGAFFIGTWPTRKIEEGLDIIYGYNTAKAENPPVNTKILSIFITSVLISIGVAYYLYSNSSLPKEAILMSGIFTLACLLWITESLPLFATAILIIGLEILLLANPGDWKYLGFSQMENPSFRLFLEPLADPILVLFFGGFILARAAVKRGVDASMATVVLRLFGNTPKRVLLGMMVITAFFSMWMSNTATATMMIALLIPIFAQIPTEKNFQKGLLLAIPFAANIGGMGTPIASPPNAIAVSYLHTLGIAISFSEWMLFSIPLVCIMLFVAFKFIYKSYKPDAEKALIKLQAAPIDGKGKYVIFIFILTIVLWLSENLHGLPTAVVALIPAIAFTSTGLITKKEVNSLEWNILLLIAGGIALGKGMNITGLDKTFALLLPENSPYIFGILLTGTLIMSTLISNTATANLLIPIGVSLAMNPVLGLDVYFAKEIAIGIALIASMAMSLPVSTAPNTIAYAQGKLTTEDFVKTGLKIGAIALVLIVSSAFGLRKLLEYFF